MSQPALIDTHCHLNVARFAADREQVLADARAAGVADLVIPAIDAAGWPGILRLCRRHAGLHPALGLHPVYSDLHGDEALHQLAGLARSEPLCAIGEIGLDFFIPGADRPRQLWLFERQLDLARKAGLPVILHNRKAHNPMLALLKRIRPPGGIVHAFNGSPQLAGEYLDLGLKLGFGGMLTYDRSRRLRGLARVLPIEAIVLETDAPDLSGAAHRGERNSPAYLPECLAALAEVRGEDASWLAEQTSANARQALLIA
ncbi:TatD family hydrolase [Magnetovirga frankeli]|uniref:TatD family hydrolase n=1 Tax=Magnetovirga frankeli TaxID=947516 RepID=UPI001292FF91|nr:TatD family hydrolase [gamma proteobacterium SS-5]